VDGSKVKANASKHKAMSYQRMGETEERLVKEVEALLAEAEAVDKTEDARYGKGKRGDELPEELRRRETRLKKIREAKAALEAQAQEKAKAQADDVRKRLAEREHQEKESGKKMGGVPPQIPDPGQAVPNPKSQKNFTDADSRIMLDGATKSFQQSYNGQLAVDAKAQIIVATGLTQDAVDTRQLVPLLVGVGENTGRLPRVATAYNGYLSEAALKDERLAGIDLYVATGRERKMISQPQPVGLEPVSGVCSTELPPLGSIGPTVEASGEKGPPSVTEQMRAKLKSQTGQATYRLRKCIVEPVFGQIKQGRGFRQFSFRGLAKVTAEWDLVALTHNLLKLFRSGWRRGIGQSIGGVL
jgi:hypothetical protein